MNQNIPPIFMLSTGALAIPRMAKKKEMKIGACKKYQKYAVSTKSGFAFYGASTPSNNHSVAKDYNKSNVP